MSFLTLRNKGWLGGDVTIDNDGRFMVVELRDVTPVRGYVIVDLTTGTAFKRQFASLHEAQKAAQAMGRHPTNREGEA